MKKAKIKDGKVKHVWPNAKGKPMPVLHPKAMKHVIDVEDYVEENMVWNKEIGAFCKLPKIPVPKPKDYLIELIIERMGWDWGEMKQTAKAREKAVWDKYKEEYRCAFNRDPRKS